MTANWSHGPIYCSSITASLVLQQIRVDPQFVVILPMHQSVNVEGVDVTLIDANQSAFVILRLIVLVVLDLCCSSLRKRWASGHFGYYIVVTFALHHITSTTPQSGESTWMQSISILLT